MLVSFSRLETSDSRRRHHAGEACSCCAWVQSGYHRHCIRDDTTHVGRDLWQGWHREASIEKRSWCKHWSEKNRNDSTHACCRTGLWRNVWRVGIVQWRKGAPPTTVLCLLLLFPLWVEFVVGPSPCSEDFSRGSLVFISTIRLPFELPTSNFHSTRTRSL